MWTCDWICYPQVTEKLNVEGKGTVDFLDFLTYIPLFIDLHETIVSDPLYGSIDL